MYAHFQALIFDLDGTLVDTMGRHEQAWRQTLTKFAIPFTPHDMQQLCGVPTLQTIEWLAEKAGIEVDAPAAAHFKEAAYAALPLDLLQPTPIVDIAREYQGRLPLAVGTGALTGEAEALLQVLGLRALFDVVVGADQVSRHKPHPDTFLHAAKRLGVAASGCCVFEDADGGLLAAQRAGMHGVDIRQLWQPEDPYFAE